MITLLDSPRAKDERRPRTPRTEPKTSVVIKVKLIDIDPSVATAGNESKKDHQRFLT